ncbi:hypothetical protein C1H46_013626 [Malus baccata]|uniref:Uncharacterized protein n=1 Tax=Malus baccata TaxID=106549 RepID=A0A540MPV9_MALBA|nr:hypothetical protein C1H46_013626 [Malus baccata]
MMLFSSVKRKKLRSFEPKLQTKLERGRMALELEEEKKAQAEREEMVQQQAKKIENMSLMVLYSNRDENLDHFKKVRRRGHANSRTQDNPPILPSHASSCFIWSNWRWRPKIITSQGLCALHSAAN